MTNNYINKGNNYSNKENGQRTFSFIQSSANSSIFFFSTDKLLANGVEVVLESESVFPRGRSYSIQELLFVDYERVS